MTPSSTTLNIVGFKVGVFRVPNESDESYYQRIITVSDVFSIR